ncbi:MAG: TonB-dependent receptor [Bacteroidota bacterium]
MKNLNQLLIVMFMACLWTANSSAQVVTGKVVDNNNQPLVGASIYEEGNLSNGTITDANGSFSLTVPSLNARLVCSFIGYKSQTISLENFEAITVKMEAGQLLDDVVVTARKTEESAQDVPMSITALDARVLARRGVIDIEGITLNTPSFSLDNFGGTKVRPAIRGLGSENTSPGQDFSTGVFYDGIYMSTNGLAAVDVYDMERVETLKGPQGALWGKNVIGGGINFIPAKPEFSNYGKLSLTGGNYATFGLTGFANLKSSDRLAHRIAFNFRRNGGYAENLTTGDRIDDMQRTSARYYLKAKASDKFTIDFSFDYTGDNNNGKNIQVFEGNQLDEFENAPGYEYLLNTYGGKELGTREEYFEDNEFGERTVFGGRLGLRFDINEKSSLQWITGYRSIEDAFFDTYNQFSTAQFIEAAIATNTEVTSLGIGDETSGNQLSSELRFESESDKSNFIAGLFVGREDGNQDFTFAVRRATPQTDSITGDISATTSETDLVWSPDNISMDLGLFAQYSYDLTEGLNFTAGARFNSNSKEFSNTYGIPAADLEIWSYTGDDSWDAVTWNTALKYNFTKNAMVYGSVATGYKPGGYQVVTTSSVEAASIPLDNETSTSVELGTKLDFKRKTRLNLSLFYTDYAGLQTVFLQPDGSATTSNIESATITGAEVEFIAALSDNLFSEIRYAYINTDVDGLQTGPDMVLNDLELLRVPEHELTANLIYRQRLKKGRLEYSGLYSYRGEMFDNPQNVPTEVRPSVGLIDAYVSYETANLEWNIQLWGKNLSNENYSVNSFGSQGSYSALLGAPRTFGVTISKFFM